MALARVSRFDLKMIFTEVTILNVQTLQLVEITNWHIDPMRDKTDKEFIFVLMTSESLLAL